jgi:hypothetical protein
VKYGQRNKFKKHVRTYPRYEKDGVTPYIPKPSKYEGSKKQAYARKCAKRYKNIDPKYKKMAKALARRWNAGLHTRDDEPDIINKTSAKDYTVKTPRKKHVRTYPRYEKDGVTLYIPKKLRQKSKKVQ